MEKVPHEVGKLVALTYELIEGFGYCAEGDIGKENF